MSVKVAMFKIYGLDGDHEAYYKPVKVQVDPKTGHCDRALEIAEADICKRYNVDPEDVEFIGLE